MYERVARHAVERGIRTASTSLVLECNTGMRRGCEKLGGKAYRTYRTYEMAL